MPFFPDPNADPYGTRNRENRAAPDGISAVRCCFFRAFSLNFHRFAVQKFAAHFCGYYIAALMTLPIVSAASRFISVVAWV